MLRAPTSSGSGSNPGCRRPTQVAGFDVHVLTAALAWKASCGCCGAGLAGDSSAIVPATQHLLEATGRLGELEVEEVFDGTRTTLLESHDEQGLFDWEEVFIDGAFDPQKRGLRRRKDQIRKRYEAGAGGGWSGCSDRMPDLVR